MSSRNERKFCSVGMKVQEEMKVLRNELKMSVAPMSRLTKRAYLRLCPEKR